MAQSLERMLRDGRTYLRILYLLLAFPLGTTYFILLVTLVSVGVSTAVIGVGLILLALSVFAWMLMARLERELAINLLGAHVPPIAIPGESLGPWQRLLKLLGDASTWKALVYVMLEFPFGILSFVLTVTLLPVSLALTAVPFAYVGAVLSGSPNIQLGTRGFTLFPNSPPFGAEFLAALLVGVLGVGLFLASIALLNGIGWAWGRFAELMLGIDPSRLQLAAAEAEASAQRSRAERADQSRRELIVNASHELRTPIASISAHVESLQKPERQIDPESRQYLGVIDTETRRLSSLVDDLLVLARADADELRITVRPVNVAEVVERVSTAMAPLARQERNLTLVHRNAADLPAAMADPDRLEQVLANLVRNAVNHTPDGGIVTLTTQADPDGVIITVADTGIGIEAQDLPRIFERFYRADQSRARDNGGSGLGLAIVRELLTAMGGTISAESTPGQGSTFTIRLKKAA